MPLSYYLGDDRYDERFAWRMFSTVRLTGCKVTAFDVDSSNRATRISLRKMVHAAWITNMTRNRQSIIRRFTERRCDEATISASRVHNVCRDPKGEQFSITYERDCNSGEFDRREVRR